MDSAACAARLLFMLEVDTFQFLKSVGAIYSSRRGTKKLSLHTLHEPARLVRKFGKNGGVKFAKLLLGKEINFFIFLADSKIVQAQLVLSGHFRSR